MTFTKLLIVASTLLPTFSPRRSAFVPYLSSLYLRASHLYSCRLCNHATVAGNVKCKLALADLPEEVYEREWDLIMIDAPKGYFAEVSGRMGEIFLTAVMERRRKGKGVTHVFLHDVDWKVKRMFTEEFLCRKYLVKGVGRLWHFKIPPVANDTSDAGATSFY